MLFQLCHALNLVPQEKLLVSDCRLSLSHLPGNLDSLEPPSLVSVTSNKEGTDAASVLSILDHRSLPLAHFRYFSSCVCTFQVPSSTGSAEWVPLCLQLGKPLCPHTGDPGGGKPLCSGNPQGTRPWQSVRSGGLFP